MNEIEYVLRIVLKARDELAGALSKARTQLRGFAKDIRDNQKDIDAFNTSMEAMDKNVGDITQKFKDWRAVIQGTGRGNKDASKSFGDLGREVENTNKATTRAARTMTAMRAEASRANKEVEALHKQYKVGGKDADYLESQLKKLGRELESLSQKFNANTQASTRAFDWSRKAKQYAAEITAAEKQITEDAIAESNKRVKAAEDEAEQKRKNYEALRDLAAEVEKDEEQRARARGVIADAEAADATRRETARHVAEAQARAEQAKADAKASAERVRIAQDEADRLDALRQRDAQARSTQARAGAVRQRVRAGDVGAVDIAEIREVVREYDRLARSFSSSSDEARHFRGEAEKLRVTLRDVTREGEQGNVITRALGQAFSGSGSSIAGFDNQMRGLGILTVVGFAQQLITVLGGLAGGFVAVAASAAEAGVAIGGAFAAGVAQALPVIGLLGAAFAQAKGAMDAMKAAQLARQQAFTQGADADKRTADAADTLKNAQEGVANAHRQLAEAQENLTKAREDGRRELEDLIKAENDAKLAAIGAALSQKEAEEALRTAVATGDTEGVRRAQLGVLQAEADAQDALNQKKRAGADADKSRAGGVEGLEGVENAKKQVEDAERAVARANRQVQTAKRNAGEAAAGADTAASKLQFLLSQMTKGQVALYRALESLRKVYQDVFGPINDIILGSFTRTVKRITALIQTPDIIKGATKLATEVSKQLNRITDAFLGDKMVAQFLRIAEAGRKNLKPVTDIIIDLGKAFLNIAEAAGPSFSRMIRFVGNLVKQFTNLTGNQDKMTKFFETGEKHFEAWVKLGLAVIRLFLALAGAGGARTGLELVNDATKAIDGLVKKINDNKGAVAEFFEDSRHIVHEVVGVLVALGEELFKAFTPERVDNFAKLLKDVIIPALGDVIEILGSVTAKVVEFAETPIGGQITKAVVAFFFLSKIAGAVVGTFLKFVRPLATIVKHLFDFGKHTGLISGNLGGILRVAARFAGIAGIIIFVLDKLGLLDDAWEEIKEAAMAFFDQVQPPIKRFIDAFKDLFAAVSGGKGAFGPLISVLRTVMKILIEVGGWILEEVLKAFGQVFGGIIDIITGFINIFTGIMTGDFGKIWEGVKDILRGAFNAILGLLTLLFFRGLGGIFKGALSVIKSVGGGLIRAMINLARTIAFGFIEAVQRLVPAIGRFLAGLPKMFFEVAKDIITFFWRGYRRIGQILRDGIEAGWRFLTRLPGRIFEIAKDVAIYFWRGYRRIGGYIRQGIEAAWGFVRRLPGRIFNIAKDVALFFWRGYRAIGRYIRKGIEDVWDWIKGLPKRLGDIAVDAAKAVVKAFKNVGKDIIGGIVGGLKELGGFAKDIANAFIDLLNAILPNKIPTPGPDIPLPKDPIPHLAAGGPVPGSGSGDKIAALLEPGEHVLTRQEVAAMGGHGAVFAFRRMLGGGGQASGPGMLLGGSPGMTRARQLSVAAGDDPEQRQDYKRSTEERAKNWRIMWNDMVTTARRAANDIEKQFRDMRVATARSADRMYRDVRGSIADIEKSFDVRGKRVVKSWADMWMSLKKVTAEGLFYIGHETNKALTALGEKHIDFHLTAPKKADDGKAGGGWIGRQGQRGADRGFYPLGAGEAVLNWQHQRYVEPAMNAYYGHGLASMFDRVHGYHAGGGGTGFAAGGFSPIPGMPGEEAATRAVPTIVKLIKKYAAVITDAYDRDRSAGHVSPGHNVTGTAIDAVPRVPDDAGWNMIEAMGKWAVSKGMTVGYGAGIPGSQAWAGHGRGNHIHIELGGNPAAVAEFADIAEIGRPLVKGGGELAKLSQAAIDMVLKAANAKLSETIPEVSGATNFPLGPGGPAQKVFDFFTGRGLSDAIAAGFVGTFQKESNFVTTVTNAAGSGATGLAQWLGGRLAALKAKPNWDSLQTQLNFVWEELHGAESGAFSAIKGARTPEEAATIIDSQYERSDNILNAPANARRAFDKFKGTGKPRKFAAGGIVPGPEGSPVPILAHAQEWILNSGQVNRIASMLGTSRAALRSMMGFYGGPGGAAGGTEVEAGGIADLTAAQVKGIHSTQLRRMVRALRRLSASMDEASSTIGSVESWSGVLQSSMKNLDQVTKRIKGKTGNKKREADFDKGTSAFISAVDNLLKETTGGFAKLRASIERRAAVAARRLLRRQFDVSGRGAGVTVARTDLGSEEQVQEAIAGRDLGEAVRQRSDLVRERNRIQGALRRVRARQKKGGLDDTQKKQLQAQETDLQGDLDDSKQRVTDNIAAIYEAQQAYLASQLATQQAITDGITKRYDLANADIDRQRRVATTLGNEGQLRNLAQQSIDNLNGLANEIESRIAATKGIGTAEAIEAATEMAEQVKDLRTQVIEATSQAIRDDIDRINTRASKSLARLDVAGRLLDAMGVVGLGRVPGVARGRADISAQRGRDLTTQRAGLQGELARAQAAKNNDLVEELNDQISELTVQIAENTKATFDAKVEAENASSSLKLSNNDLNAQIVQLDGQISGNTDQARLLQLAQEKQAILEQHGRELQKLFDEAQAAGNQAAMDDLTTQMLQNTVATRQNTISTNELTGNLSKDQGFTTTAFEVFSQAIFTGSGGVLPFYKNAYQSLFPTAQAGADVTSGGMLMVHAGEKVIPAKVNSLTSNTVGGETNVFDIDIHEAGRPINWGDAATQIMFKKSGAK